MTVEETTDSAADQEVTDAAQTEEDPEAALEASEDNFDNTDDNEPDKVDTEDKTEDEPEQESEEESEPEESAKEPAKETEPKETEEPQSDEEKRKAYNKEQAEKRIKARQEREATLREDQEKYLAEADKDDPRDLAVRQLQVDAYNNKVDNNTNKLTNAYERAVKDFDILSDASPEIQTEVNSALDAFQAMHVTIDGFGNPVDVRGDLYAYLQAKADSITALTGKGARQQIKSKSKEKSKTLTPPARAPKERKQDPDLDAFDEEAQRW